jgi:hypothetical protein
METLESHTEYDLFDYENSAQPLSLDEAIKVARALRVADKSHRFRIVPTDDKETGFRVEAISQERLYADFLAMVSTFLNRFLAKRTAR